MIFNSMLTHIDLEPVFNDGRCCSTWLVTVAIPGALRGALDWWIERLINLAYLSPPVEQLMVLGNRSRD